MVNNKKKNNLSNKASKEKNNKHTANNEDSQKDSNKDNIDIKETFGKEKLMVKFKDRNINNKNTDTDNMNNYNSTKGFEKTEYNLEYCKTKETNFTINTANTNETKTQFNSSTQFN
ncbi:hypothetical protein GW820_05320, partial [archaeon]|nr:hypothetical protein [archaeon]